MSVGERDKRYYYYMGGKFYSSLGVGRMFKCTTNVQMNQSSHK